MRTRSPAHPTRPVCSPGHRKGGVPGRLASLGLSLALALGACATTPPPGVEKEAKPADLEALKTVGGKANGLVVWSSTRAGIPHIFTMRTDGSDVKQVTKGAQTDWFPRFSPDGTKILFCRSQDDGYAPESTANTDGTWDIYTINVDGTGISKAVDNGCWGSWSGPEEILFVRGALIMRAKVGTDDESKVTDTSRYPTFDAAVVEEPELSLDGHSIALTLGGMHSSVGVWGIKKKTWRGLGLGTGLTWSPDGGALVWINPSGRGFSEIARVALENGKPPETIDRVKARLVDLQGKRSQELFPRLSRDGKWLVFGATNHDVHPDSSETEVYLWEIGSEERPTRLTFNSAEDRWPDIFSGAPGQAKADEKADDGKSGDSEKAETEAPAVKLLPAEKNDSGETNDAGKSGEINTEKGETKSEEQAAPADEASSTSDADEATPTPKPRAKAKGKKKRR